MDDDQFSEPLIAPFLLIDKEHLQRIVETDHKDVELNFLSQ